MGRTEKILFAWLVAMLVGVTATGAYVVVEHVTRCSRFEFSAAEWRGDHADRNETAHRLVECHRLQGLGADEVTARLGKPEERSKGQRGAVTLSYDADIHEGFMFPVAETLEVDLSAGHVVRRAWIEQLSD
jgi:putative component of membrane protein insertase Oxa1/YidC/SpoIIIJ protein YidD